jgi:hypothetical protein
MDKPNRRTGPGGVQEAVWWCSTADGNDVHDERAQRELRKREEREAKERARQERWQAERERRAAQRESSHIHHHAGSPVRSLLDRLRGK